MKFFNHTPTINAYDTETYQNTLKVICDAYGNTYEPDGNPDSLLKWLMSTKSIPFPIFNPLSDGCHIYPMM